MGKPPEAPGRSPGRSPSSRCLAPESCTGESQSSSPQAGQTESLSCRPECTACRLDSFPGHRRRFATTRSQCPHRWWSSKPGSACASCNVLGPLHSAPVTVLLVRSAMLPELTGLVSLTRVTSSGSAAAACVDHTASASSPRARAGAQNAVFPHVLPSDQESVTFPHGSTDLLLCLVPPSGIRTRVAG